MKKLLTMTLTLLLVLCGAKMLATSLTLGVGFLGGGGAPPPPRRPEVRPPYV